MEIVMRLGTRSVLAAIAISGLLVSGCASTSSTAKKDSGAKAPATTPAPTPAAAPAPSPAAGAVPAAAGGAAASPPTKAPAAGIPPIVAPPVGGHVPPPFVAPTPGSEKPLEWPKPPDGKWLTDEKGRQYYVGQMKKPPPAAFKRMGPNSVRLAGGTPLVLDHEDDEYFYPRIYKVTQRSAPAKPNPRPETPEAKAALEAQYTTESKPSDRLRFEPTGKGLPTTGQWRNGFRLVDINKDGHLDLVHNSPRRRLNGRPVIYLGDGKGNFTQWAQARFPNIPYEYGDIDVGDFDGDGNLDLVVGVHLRGIVVLYGDGKGNFTLASNGPHFEPGRIQENEIKSLTSKAVRVVDWFGDGKLEILAEAEGPSGSFLSEKGYTRHLQESFGVEMLRRSPEGKWELVTGNVTAPGIYGDDVTLGDFNGDGKIDFAAATNAGDVRKLAHIHQPDDTWLANEVVNLRPSSYAFAVAAGDFDHDGFADLAVAYLSEEKATWHSGVDVYFGSKDFTWKRRTVYAEPTKVGFTSLAVGDLDGDGNLDLVAGSHDGRVLVFLGDGKGNFTMESTKDLAADNKCRVYHLALGNLDGGKGDDLVAAYAGEECPNLGSIRAWKGVPNEAGGSTPPR